MQQGFFFNFNYCIVVNNTGNPGRKKKSEANFLFFEFKGKCFSVFVTLQQNTVCPHNTKKKKQKISYLHIPSETDFKDWLKASKDSKKKFSRFVWFFVFWNDYQHSHSAPSPQNINCVFFYSINIGFFFFSGLAICLKLGLYFLIHRVTVRVTKPFFFFWHVLGFFSLFKKKIGFPPPSKSPSKVFFLLFNTINTSFFVSLSLLNKIKKPETR